MLVQDSYVDEMHVLRVFESGFIRTRGEAFDCFLLLPAMFANIDFDFNMGVCV